MPSPAHAAYSEPKRWRVCGLCRTAGVRSFAGPFRHEAILGALERIWGTMRATTAMKQHLKRIISRFWRLTQPVRHPLVRRLTQFLDERFANQLAPRFARVDAIQCNHGELVRDLELLSESMVRELVRLQTQVESIERLLQTVVADSTGEGATQPATSGVRDRAA